jgi:hypothetical protein
MTTLEVIDGEAARRRDRVAAEVPAETRVD